VAISLTHAFASAKADGSDSTFVQPSNWNAEHVITMASGKILGRTSSGTGVVEELDPTTLVATATFPAGTAMLFAQTSAPTGWTKSVAHNDKALRVVSGAASSGGATAFTTVFGAGKTTGSHILTQANLPSYNLSVGSLTGSVGTSLNNGSSVTRNFDTDTNNNRPGGGSGDVVTDASWDSDDLTLASGAVTFGGTIPSGGSGTGHTHTVALDLQYVDVIIATKD
jgi:hypothetical protein